MEYLYRKLLREEEPPVEPGQPAAKKKKVIKHTIHKNATTTVAKLLTLLQPRNWQASYLFSTEEVAILESHIDRGRGIFPSDDNIKIQEIGKQLGLAPAHVKYYFYRVQQNYERRLLTMRDKNRADELKRTVEGEEDAVLLEKNRQKVQEVLKRGTSSTSSRTPKSRKEPSEVTLEESDFGFIKKRIRTIWAAEDEALLMHAYAIIRYLSISRGVRFSWVPIANALNANRELCRRRMAVLLKTKLNEEKVNFLVAEWPNYYENGVKNGVLDVIPVGELIGIDIKLHTRNYHANSNALAGHPSADSSEVIPLAPVVVIPLPETPEILERHFYAYPFHGAISKANQLKEQLDVMFTVRSKMSALYSVGLLSDVGNQALLDNLGMNHRNSERSMDIVKAMACVKAVMCTPEIMYDSDLAFRLLYQFTTPTVNQGLEKLMEEGSLVKNKKGYRDRTVPGRALTLSDKFLTTIAGALPSGLIPQVLNANMKVFESISDLRNIPPLDNGVMCVVLESLVHDVIKLTPKFPNGNVAEEAVCLISNKYIQSKEELPQADHSLKSFDELTGDIGVKLKEAVATIAGSAGDVARLVNDVIIDAGSQGLSLLDIK
ncbi:UNVERIFIED_CONTAM: hypothetical protein HDU68_006233, partial [Siphonaria sp. JEL0065]